jgi:hypothetical protein
LPDVPPPATFGDPTGRCPDVLTMNLRKWTVTFAAVAVPAVVGIWLLQGRPVAAPRKPTTAALAPQPAALAPLTTPELPKGTSGIAAARAAHEHFLAAAAKVEATPLLPQVQPVDPNAATPQAPEPALPPVAPENTVAIGFTGNVIGETDPCG